MDGIRRRRRELGGVFGLKYVIDVYGELGRIKVNY